MNKRKKRELSEMPGGIGAIVVDGDINLALRVFKQEVKNSGILREVYRRKEFVKPSTLKREQTDRSKYRQRMQSLSN